MKRESEKRDVFERYIGEIAKSCHAITGADAAEVYDALLTQAKRRTEIADAVLDEDGKIVGFADGNGRLDNDDGVIIVGPNGDPPPPTNDQGGTTGRADTPKPKPGATKKKRPAKPAAKPPKRNAAKDIESKPTKTAPGKKPKPRMRVSPEGGLFEVTN